MTASTWTCNRCRVRISYMPGYAAPPTLPEGWADEGEGLRCLRCRRAVIVHTALLAARAAGEDRNEQRVQRDALIAFELRRDHTRSSLQIARLVGSTAAVVGQARRRFEAAEEGGDDG